MYLRLIFRLVKSDFFGKFNVFICLMDTVI